MSASLEAVNAATARRADRDDRDRDDRDRDDKNGDDGNPMG
jgi:hypothetical protein